MSEATLSLDQAARLIGTTIDKLQELAETCGMKLDSGKIDSSGLTKILTTTRFRIRFKRDQKSLDLEFISSENQEEETVYFIMVEPEEAEESCSPFFLEVRAASGRDSIFELISILKNVLYEIDEFEPKLIRIKPENVEIDDIVPPEFGF